VRHAIDPLCHFNRRSFTTKIPGSKSFTNRALIIAAQRMGESRIQGALHSDDTDRLAAGLNSFHGLSVEKSADGYRVRRTSEQLGAPDAPIYIAGAGTPARFLLGFAAMANGETVVTGNARLNERPMGDILRAFDRIGVRYECTERPDVLPVRIVGSRPSTQEWSVSGAVSSQFTSSLLLLASQQDGKQPIQITVHDRLVSRPYVNMTVQMLREVGVPVDVPALDRFVVSPSSIAADLIEIEPDASGMSYLLGAAAITGTSVTIPGIRQNSAQGDVGFARLLERMGCSLSFDAAGLTLSSSGGLTGIEADMDEMPDTVLTLAVVAAFAQGPTRITNVGNLRVKECDRLHAAAAELGRIGVSVEEGPDYLVIRPGGAFNSAEITTYDDHRVAMAFSLVGLIHSGITIENPACVAKSFPSYWDEFARFQNHHAALAA
jgi:3-phosphoshikimate 1-carboxyvinyltransferase